MTRSATGGPKRFSLAVQLQVFWSRGHVLNGSLLSESG